MANVHHEHSAPRPGEVCEVYDEAPDTPLWVPVLGFFILAAGIIYWALLG